MSRRQEDLLQAALEASAGGQDPELVTAGLSHGESADLRSLLAAAAAARTLGRSDVPPDAARRSRSRLLRKAASLPTGAGATANSRVLLPRFSAAALVAVAALALGLGGLTEATATSLPGDVLYPIKIAAADLRLRLEFEAAQHQRLESLFAKQRLEDVRILLGLGRVAPVSWEGRVQSMGPLWWTIEDVLIEITPQTRIAGTIVPGRIVEVEGVSQANGTIRAHEVRLRAFDLFGTVHSIGADRLEVDGEIFRLTPDSVIDPALDVGERALLHVAIDDAGVPSVLSAVLFAPPTPTAVSIPSRTPPTPPPPTAGPTAAATEDHSGPGSETGQTDEDDDGETDPDEDQDEDEPDSEELQFEGIVQSISGSTWVIDGYTIRVDGDTEIKDDPGVGDNVKVVAFLQSDGTWWAEKVELED